MNTTTLIQFIYLILLGALYLPVIFFTIQRRNEGHETASWFVAFYALLAMVLNVTETAWPIGEDGFLFQEIQIYAAFSLAVIMILALKTFIKTEAWWGWIGFWAVWVLGLALILTNALHIPDTVWTNGSLALFRSRLGPAWAILGWLIIATGLILVLVNAGRHASQQLFRNRLYYWWPAIILTFVNDILLFSGINTIGQPLRVAVAIVLAYVISTHHLPDIKNNARRLITFLVISTAIVVFYVAGFLLLQTIFGEQPNFNPLLAGAFIALLLAIIFTPLTSRISQAINKWMKGDQYDASQTTHQYSEIISNILDMDKLANLAVNIILEGMQIERGYLFLVDGERRTNGQKTYKLRSARNAEERQKVAVELEENGLIASYFLREQQPLLQYDLDLLPVFRLTHPFERDWFRQLHAEVYIPIFSKKQWIGLLAFGSKSNGNRYTKNDLFTLSSHASQTAVALENARLVEHLLHLNNELRQTRRALEKNNQSLERLDEAKSDFISIASHELRTPLTVIKGYSEMLVEDKTLDPTIKNMIKSIYDGTMRLHEVMDSMFDIAQIDARSLKVQIQPMELGSLIREVCMEQAKHIHDREQHLSLDLPPLPQIKADPKLLKKLFHHLIRNAAKFTPNQGKVSVKGHYIPAIINLPDGGVEIIISDTGVGVDPALRDIIFTKFYQPGELNKHSTSKTRFKGSGAGLGLALSKGIIEAHGGQIWVESPGYDEINFPGSQFHIIFPLTKLENGGQQKMSESIKFEVAKATEGQNDKFLK